MTRTPITLPPIEFSNSEVGLLVRCLICDCGLSALGPLRDKLLEEGRAEEERELRRYVGELLVPVEGGYWSNSDYRWQVFSQRVLQQFLFDLFDANAIISYIDSPPTPDIKRTLSEAAQRIMEESTLSYSNGGVLSLDRDVESITVVEVDMGTGLEVRYTDGPVEFNLINQRSNGNEDH